MTVTYQPVERDTDAAISLIAPATIDALQQAVAEAPRLVWLEAHLNIDTGQTFTGWLTAAPPGRYQVVCEDGNEATIESHDQLFWVG